jgi:GNAT superfamily N-acetyltransferase
LRYQDVAAVLELINADQLPGQPTCQRDALDMALRGESPVDMNWWRELASVQAVVARQGGAPVGVASYAVAPADRSGWLLWLHAREQPAVVECLLDHVMAELTGSSHLYAFWIASALTLGVEALPLKRRPVTDEILRGRGLVGHDSWRYLLVRLEPATIEPGADEVAMVIPASGPGEMPAWRLTVGDPQMPIASADIALGPEGCGVLWWLEVDGNQRGRGLGRRLVQQALRFLALHGASAVATFVDHDAPVDRRPAIRLFESVGFRELDRLWSYQSPRRSR